MRFPIWILAAFAAAAPPAAAQESEIVVRAGVRQFEIERILAADNMDTSVRTARDVADSMAGIRRGRAPLDFWVAYQAHVRAWKRLAVAVESHRPQEQVNAERAIEETFDSVERLARGYGARVPPPAWKGRTAG